MRSLVIADSCLIMNKSLCAYPSWRSENGMSMDNVRMAFSTMVGARKKCNECNYKHFCIILTRYLNDYYIAIKYNVFDMLQLLPIHHEKLIILN